MGTSTTIIQYRYDGNRNRTLMIDPDGGRTTYSYDLLNRITSIINPALSGTGEMETREDKWVPLAPPVHF